MRLIYDWKRVLTKAWSIRLMILAGVLSALEVVLPLYQDKFPRKIFALASFIVTIFAVVARLYAQPKMYQGEKDET